MSTAEDLIKWASMFDLLFEREAFKLWWVHPNGARAPGARMHPSLRRLPYSTRVWEPGAPPLAWEIAMRREGTRQAALPYCPKGARSAFPRSRAATA